MASAIKPDAWLENAAGFPANNSNGPGTLQAQYGLGKASARTSVLNRDQAEGWISGGAITELEAAQYAWHDIVVPEDASRLDLVMTWGEPPTDTIGSAVLNDLDLWLDRDGDCGPEACGEHVSASRVDNVEWIILRNPPSGVYRAKPAARRVYTSAPRAPLAWTVIRGASTPSLRIGPILTGGCISLEDVVFNDTHYAVVNSKWQTRASSDAEWTDIRGTETTGEVCVYSPARTGDYGLVVEIRIDGELGKYSSNTIRW